MQCSNKTQITKTEYLQLTGLVALAKRHRMILEEIVKTGVEILQETDDGQLYYHGHFADMIWGGEEYSDLKDTIRKLNIEIKTK